MSVFPDPPACCPGSIPKKIFGADLKRASLLFRSEGSNERSSLEPKLVAAGVSAKIIYAIPESLSTDFRKTFVQ
jgi:hypothetical protein